MKVRNDYVLANKSNDFVILKDTGNKSCVTGNKSIKVHVKILNNCSVNCKKLVDTFLPHPVHLDLFVSFIYSQCLNYRVTTHR